jgi:hypothetical protein
MADILSQYGSDSSQPQEARASKGGELTPKPLAYSPPVGPRSGSYTNHGCCGTSTQGKH